MQEPPAGALKSLSYPETSCRSGISIRAPSLARRISMTLPARSAINTARPNVRDRSAAAIPSLDQVGSRRHTAVHRSTDDEKHFRRLRMIRSPHRGSALIALLSLLLLYGF